MQWGNVSLDGSKIHADAAKSKAARYKRLLAMSADRQAEVNELFALVETADGGQWPDEMNIRDEIERREQPLARHDPNQLLGLIRRQTIVRAYNMALVRRAELQHRTKQIQLNNLDGAEFVTPVLSSLGK